METKDSRESSGLIKQRKWRRIIEYSEGRRQSGQMYF